MHLESSEDRKPADARRGAYAGADDLEEPGEAEHRATKVQEKRRRPTPRAPYGAAYRHRRRHRRGIAPRRDFGPLGKREGRRRLGVLAVRDGERAMELRGVG